jgi:hypothetical protein
MGRPSKYREEFRREAVALYRSSDRSRAAVGAFFADATPRSTSRY